MKAMKGNEAAWSPILRLLTRAVLLSTALFTASSVLAEGASWAASKEECLDAHGRGQDLRDAGHLTSARQAFMACAQSACPAVIQADCARFGEELDRLVPSIAFAARDGAGHDLLGTIVYVDEAVTAARLDDGKPYELDPGKHTLRFVHDGRETTVNIVLSQGEKARSVVATFADPHAAPAGGEPWLPPTPPAPSRSLFPLVVAGVGAVAAGTGAVLTVVGLGQVPSNCSTSSHECVAAPGDPSFDQAHHGVTLANMGLGVGIGGAALLAGGTIWYFVQKPQAPKDSAAMARAPVVPWFGPHAGGLALSTMF